MTRQRPGLLTVLAILAIIGGALSLLAALAAFGIGGLGLAGGAAAGSTQTATAGGTLIVIGVLALVGGIFSLLFGIGTLLGQGWAWILGIIGEGLNLLGGIVAIVIGAINNTLGSAITGNIVGIVIAAAILYYLNTPAVKAYFGRA